MPTVSPRVVTVAGQRFELWKEDVVQKLRYVLPEPIVSHYVVIDERRYPPKQVIGVLTGIDRADFTTHQARRILAGLGFAPGRLPRPDERDRNTGYEAHAQPRVAVLDSRSYEGDTLVRPDASSLEPFVGQWVATRGRDVLVAARDPRTVVSWLAEHRRQADSMFLVPGDEFQAGGLAPL